jgi:hypothetical protein
MSNQNKQLTKQAADSVAEEYWTQYYKDSGYGALWVREIPKRVKAELTKQTKTASAQAPSTEPTLHPLSTVITDKAVHLEGLAIFGQGDSRKVKAFVIDFGHDGTVHGFDVVDSQ